MALNKAKIEIHRTRIGKDIVAEFAVPTSKKHQKAGRVAIMGRGMPSASSARGYIEFLAQKGFYVICPQYRGAWESSGKFLKQEPTEDIRLVVQHADKQLMSFGEGIKISFPKNPKIFLFVSSFGGPAGLLLSKHKKVEKVIALCPVVDWNMKSKDEPMDWMFRFLKNAFGEGYRLSKKDWQKLGKGSFYNPVQQLGNIDAEKILIIHTEDDRSVPASDVIQFARRTGIKLILKKKGGHGGFKKMLEPQYWREIVKFLK